MHSCTRQVPGKEDTQIIKKMSLPPRTSWSNGKASIQTTPFSMTHVVMSFSPDTTGTLGKGLALLPGGRWVREGLIKENMLELSLEGGTGTGQVNNRRRAENARSTERNNVKEHAGWGHCCCFI